MEYIEQPEAQQPDVIPEARKAYSRSLLNIALFFLIAFAIIQIVRQFLPDEISSTVVYLLNYIPMYLIAFPIYLLISKPMPTAAPEHRHMPVGQILLAFLCCECIAISGNLIGSVINLIISWFVGVDTSSTFLQDGIFGDSSTLFIGIAVLGAPIVEEMIFRKVLIDRIRKYGDRTAILISGLMFGLFHGNLSQFFYAAGLGMLFAFIYIRTGNIRNTITLHMMVNFWGSAMPLLLLRNVDLETLFSSVTSGSYSEISGVLSSMIPFFCFVILNYTFALAGLIILILNRRRMAVNPPIAPIPKGQRFRTACLNIGFFALLSACVYEFIQQFLSVLQ